MKQKQFEETLRLYEPTPGQLTPEPKPAWLQALEDFFQQIRAAYRVQDGKVKVNWIYVAYLIIANAGKLVAGAVLKDRADGKLQ